MISAHFGVFADPLPASDSRRTHSAEWYKEAESTNGHQFSACHRILLQRRVIAGVSPWRDFDKHTLCKTGA